MKTFKTIAEKVSHNIEVRYSTETKLFTILRNSEVILTLDPGEMGKLSDAVDEIYNAASVIEADTDD